MLAIPDALRRALEDRYELEDVVGRGGMATVYRAHDPKHGRSVAVKVLRSDLGEVVGPERFLREIEIAARLTHPNILPLYDSGDAEGQLYYVMPFIEGESLRGLLHRVRLMDTAGAIEITRRVADALDYAHRQGVVHRDIKPENILLPDGQPVVADFGIARAASGAAGLTRTGLALGTPGYMSPEQAAGLLDLGPTTDVYSLGVVTYEMVVGVVPRGWVTPDVLAEGRLLDAEPEHRTRLDRLPAGMERALLHALALRPEERFPSAGEFASALEAPETLSHALSAQTAETAAGDERAAPRRPATAAAGARFPMTRRTVSTAPAPAAGFLGGPAVLIAERVVDGDLPPEDFDDLVEEVRATFRAVGHTARTERTVIWTTRRPKETGRAFDWNEMFSSDDDVPDVLLRASSRHGQTRIRLEQRLGPVAGGIFGGVWGGGGGGGLGALLSIGIAVFHAPAGLLVAVGAGWVGGTYALARAIYRAVVRSKQHRLESLADRLAEQCEHTEP